MKHERILEMAEKLDLNMQSLSLSIMELTDPYIREQPIQEMAADNSRQTSLAEFLNYFPERMDNMCNMIQDMQNELLQVVAEPQTKELKEELQTSKSITR